VLYGGHARRAAGAQIETGESLTAWSPRQTFWRILVPQMWFSHALPGLGNLLEVLIQGDPAASCWASKNIVVLGAVDLGGARGRALPDYPHPDWRMWYFLALLGPFTFALPVCPEIVLEPG